MASFTNAEHFKIARRKIAGESLYTCRNYPVDFVYETFYGILKIASFFSPSCHVSGRARIFSPFWLKVCRQKGGGGERKEKGSGLSESNRARTQQR